MELAAIACVIGKSVAEAARNFKRKRRLNSGKYTRLADETAVVVDGKPALLEKFLHDTILGKAVDPTFINPFQTLKQESGSPLPSEESKCSPVSDPDSSFEEWLPVRTPGDGSETPVYHLERQADGKNHETFPTPKCPITSSKHATKKRLVQWDSRKIRKPRRLLDTGKSPKYSKTRHVSGAKHHPATGRYFKRVPSLNTAFLQNDTCSVEETLLLMTSDSALSVSRGGSDVYSCLEDTNVLDNAFINYGIL